jgi:hypothetical protein
MIPLGEGRFALVDPCDFYWLNKYHWFAEMKSNLIYAARNVILPEKKKKIIYMHREIMNFPIGLLVDHKNNNSIDNRRPNLRLATHAQNVYNRRKTRSKTTSRFIGVSFDKINRNWKVQIRHQGKTIFIGRFDSEIEAARAYDRAAIKYHGEFARLNFPRENYVNEIPPTND